MKRFFSVLLFVLTILSLLAAFAWGGYCIWDYQQLAADATHSSIDFLMVGVWYGIGLALICIVGAVCALIQCRLANHKSVQIFDYIAVTVFLLGMILAFILMFV